MPALQERAVAEARLEVDVEALIHVRLAAEVVREADQAVGRQVLREHRRLEVLHAAHLVVAAARQIRIARRRDAERVVAAGVVAQVVGEGLRCRTCGDSSRRSPRCDPRSGAASRTCTRRCSRACPSRAAGRASTASSAPSACRTSTSMPSWSARSNWMLPVASNGRPLPSRSVHDARVRRGQRADRVDLVGERNRLAGDVTRVARLDRGAAVAEHVHREADARRDVLPVLHLAGAEVARIDRAIRALAERRRRREAARRGPSSRAIRR